MKKATKIVTIILMVLTGLGVLASMRALLIGGLLLKFAPETAKKAMLGADLLLMSAWSLVLGIILFVGCILILKNKEWGRKLTISAIFIGIITTILSTAYTIGKYVGTKLFVQQTIISSLGGVTTLVIYTVVLVFLFRDRLK